MDTLKTLDSSDADGLGAKVLKLVHSRPFLQEMEIQVWCGSGLRRVVMSRPPRHRVKIA
jgi:hypothetical protein